MPLQATSGAASQDAFGGNGVAVVPAYIEDVFSTYLFTGTETTRSITNDIDLSTKGGLVWIKGRNAGYDNNIIDTATGSGLRLRTNSAVLQAAAATGVTSFNTNGFSLGTSPEMNGSTVPYVSWTFRKQPKFFDIQTWTGSGANRTISHSLGSIPACIMVKRTDTTGNWQVYHRSLANTQYLVLNLTDAAATGATRWNSTTPTSTVFSLGTDASVNASAGTYVAYIFAHDAGGFGLTGSDNVISCGSFTTDGSGNATVSLGYEPQWLMVKASSAVQSWYIEDNMRAFNLTARAILFPNLSNAEATGATAYLAPNSTGFAAVNGQLNASTTYIYIAIRRGPMKVPTTGTSVFSPNAHIGTEPTRKVITAGFPVDLSIQAYRNLGGAAYFGFTDRLRGGTQYLVPYNTSAEGASASPDNFLFDSNTTLTSGQGAWNNTNANGLSFNLLRRAPSFFDEVCYTGTGSATTFAHNLGVVPELMIVKKRSAATGGSVYSTTIGNTQQLELFSGTGNSAAFVDTTQWNSTTPTSSVFTVGTNGGVNGSGSTYVAWLFATCAGVSKVGSYTGTATTKQIDCCFTAGSRFIMIKRTDSTGDWYVWDSARGIVAGNDPYLLLNSTAAEVTNTDYVDTYSAGFEISSTAPAAINANGGSFIFLAIS